MQHTLLSRLLHYMPAEAIARARAVAASSGGRSQADATAIAEAVSVNAAVVLSVLQKRLLSLRTVPFAEVQIRCDAHAHAACHVLQSQCATSGWCFSSALHSLGATMLLLQHARCGCSIRLTTIKGASPSSCGVFKWHQA
jgi:hypothetical protein